MTKHFTSVITDLGVCFVFNYVLHLFWKKQQICYSQQQLTFFGCEILVKLLLICTTYLLFFPEKMFDDLECDCFVPCHQTTFEPRLSHADLSRVNLEPFVLSSSTKKKEHLQVRSIVAILQFFVMADNCIETRV